ncbi:hypothetical protein PHAVU_008G263500 [Phaseolus vulgaris]|uniref:DUF740 family protein n=1 Tax=Phaseolus vulgaris TaxID=3885 RepID=V7B8M4_PHAVU|nr:hypothetical protein PHAVU_008G263500g [Phaseolus vulgaris]ESW14227.1 hypothetical protein PHAVU_008G263500g [Phaseolus vulgaris]
MTPKSYRLSACHRHPTAPITGFCALCLRERLAGIPSDHSPPSPSLRRSKSCARPADDHATADPRRRSCEVRPRSSLSDLFSRDDTRKSRSRKQASVVRVSNDESVADEETKTVKEFIDLELQLRKRKAARDSRTFWNAAAEKFKKWKWKHRSKKSADVDDNVKGNAEKRSAQRLRETRSEVGECNLGRRSCDMDPRFSIEAGRISFDCPRASWDGCLIGKPCSRLSPMLSLDEDSNSNNTNNNNSNNNSVGLESSGDGRRSFGFDRSSSRRKQSVAGLDELKLMSNANVNAKVSPATFYGAKLLITEKELMDSYVRSSADAVESGCVMESDSKDVSGAANRQKGVKKLQKWRDVWSKLGLVQRTERREDGIGEEECDSGVVVDKPLAESLQRLRRVVNVQASEPVGQKLMRSYSVSCRSPCRTDGFAEDSESKGSALNGRHDFMFQRNRSVRYSPNNPDTGLLRFYLTPSKSYKRSKAGKSSVKDLHSAARSGL